MTLTKQQKIDRIYEVIAGKAYPGHKCSRGYNRTKVMIGDILERQIRNNCISYEGTGGQKLRSRIVEMWEMYQKDLTDQSEECIDFIFNYISGNSQ